MAKRYPGGDPENGPAEEVVDNNEYQKRMVAAHELMAAINEMQAKLYSLWQRDNRQWDNYKRVDKELINLYHQADETLMALKEATNVAHYG